MVAAHFYVANAIGELGKRRRAAVRRFNQTDWRICKASSTSTRRYESVVADYDHGRASSEEVYTWSTRWREAIVKASQKPEELLAGYADHRTVHARIAS